MVAKNSDDSSVLRLDDYLTTHDINSVLIYHFSIFDPYFSCFLELKWKKKILYYHGITPPEFLKSPLADECRSGLLKYLNSLASIYICSIPFFYASIFI